MLWWALYKAENVLLGSGLRKMALEECMKHIHYEASMQRGIHGCEEQGLSLAWLAMRHTGRLNKRIRGLTHAAQFLFLW